MTQREPQVSSPFEALSGRYDAWYDSPAGRVLVANELAALGPLLEGTGHPRLEIGVGTGRFATALGLDVGVDVAFTPLAYAHRRGVYVAQGVGESLPFADDSFRAVVLVATLCFVQDPTAVLAEARRVLHPGGRLVAAVVPRDSRWGQHYQAMGRDGNPFYRDAHFLSVGEITSLLSREGFTIVAIRSTLLQPPSSEPHGEVARDGAPPDAGFVAIAAVAVGSSAGYD